MGPGFGPGAAGHALRPGPGERPGVAEALGEAAGAGPADGPGGGATGRLGVGQGARAVGGACAKQLQRLPTKARNQRRSLRPVASEYKIRIPGSYRNDCSLGFQEAIPVEMLAD
jgi:hypothetical protein